MHRLTPLPAGHKRIYNSAHNLVLMSVGIYEVLGIEGQFTKDMSDTAFWNSVGHLLNARYLMRRDLPKSLFDSDHRPLTAANIPNRRYLIDPSWGRIYAARATNIFTYYSHMRYILTPIVAYVPRSSETEFIPTEQESIRVLSVHSKKLLAAFTLWLDKARERLQLAHAMGDYGNANKFMSRDDVVRIGADVYKHRGTPQEFITQMLEIGTVPGPLPASEEFSIGTTCYYQDYIVYLSGG